MMQLSKRKRFENWQGTNASTQQHFFDTALRVEAYLKLKKLKLSQIKKDIEGVHERSWHYQLIYNAPWQQRLKGVLLYCILDIDEASDLLSTPKEDEILTLLLSDLCPLYLNSLEHPAERIEQLISHIRTFLQIEFGLFSNKNKVKEIHNTLYLALGTISQILSDPPIGSSLFSVGYGVDFKKNHESVVELMRLAEDRINMFEMLDKKTAVIAVANTDEIKVLSPDQQNNIIASAAETNTMNVKLDETVAEHAVVLEVKDVFNGCIFAEQVTLTSEQRMVQNYFDMRYLELFSSEATIQEKLTSLLGFSAEIKQYLEQLKANRDEEVHLLAQKTQITMLLNAFNKNETRLLGRKYFLDLLEQYSDEFRVFRDLLPTSEQASLQQFVEELEEQIPVVSNSLYALSTVFSPVTIFARALLSKENQQYFASFVPETSDAQAKEFVKKQLPEVLANLHNKLLAIKQQKQQTLLCLFSGNTALEVSIATVPTTGLVNLAELNSVEQKYDDLAAFLPNIMQQDNSLIAPKNPFQQRYVDIISADGDEKVKILSLIDTMSTVAKDLEVLRSLKTRSEGLLLKIYPLRSLMDLFNQHTTNQLIGPVVNKPLKQLQSQLNDVSKEIETLVNRFSSASRELKEWLKQSSVDSLQALLEDNTVPEHLYSTVLGVVDSDPIAQKLAFEEKTIGEYFKDRYIALLNHDAHEEEQRLNNAIEDMHAVDKSIKQLITVRERYDVLAASAQKVRAVLQAIESNQMNLQLINLIKERAQALEIRMATEQGTINSIAALLAVDQEPLKQLLVHKKTDTLINLTRINQAARECIEEYKILRDKISLLNLMTKGTSSLDSYVAEHYTWWVRLTNFLARFLSIFKTSTGQTIDEARALRAQINTCKMQCERDINAHIEIIKKDPVIGHDLLGDLPEQHEHQHITLSEAEKKPFDADYAENLLSSLSLLSIYAPKSSQIILEEEDRDDECYDECYDEERCRY